jgi:hypothetical protein
VLTDVAASVVGLLVYSVVLGLIVDAATGTDSELAALMQSSAGRIGSLAIGAGGTVIGGYIAARMARRKPVSHGVGVGTASLLLSAIPALLGEPGTADPLWVRTIEPLFAIPAGAFGGHLWSVRQCSESAPRMPAMLNVYQIDPRRFRKDKFYIAVLTVFWLIWFPVTCFATALVFTEGPVLFLSVWLIAGWAAAILIPVGLAQRNRKQTLTVIADRLRVSGTALFSGSSVQLHREDLRALTLERYRTSDSDPSYSLNLLQREGARPARVVLAPYVHPEGKAILLGEIEQFLVAYGFPIEAKNDWGSPNPRSSEPNC